MGVCTEKCDKWGQGSRIGAAIVIGVVVGCVFAFFYPYGFFYPDPPAQTDHPFFKYNVLVSHSSLISLFLFFCLVLDTCIGTRLI